MMRIGAPIKEAFLGTPVYRWYEQKSRTDQRILRLLLILSLGLFLFIGVCQPISEFQSAERVRASTNQGLFEWIAVNRNELSLASQLQASGSSGPASDGPTIARITNSAAQFNIVLSRLQPEADGSVSVAVEQQSFNQVMLWLGELEQTQGYVVARGSIDQGNEPGLVNGQFRFR